jgi:hypothetical protein
MVGVVRVAIIPGALGDRVPLMREDPDRGSVDEGMTAEIRTGLGGVTFVVVSLILGSPLRLTFKISAMTVLPHSLIAAGSP